jgi:proteasome lid subunit RPN8/RPN11
MAGLATMALSLLAFDRRSRQDRDSVVEQAYATASDPLPSTVAHTQDAARATRYPTLRIDPLILAQIQTYARAVPGEITLLGASEYDAQQSAFVLRRVFLPSQVCTASTTEVGEEGLAEVLIEAMAQGLTVNVWIHSHGALAVFFSGTDMQNIAHAFPQAHWILSIVINHAGDMLARFTQFSPIAVEIDHLPITLDVSEDLENVIQAEVKAKVRQTWDRWEKATHRHTREPGNSAAAPPAVATSSYGVGYTYHPLDGTATSEDRGSS